MKEKFNRASALVAQAMALGAFSGADMFYESNRIHNGVSREYHPWDKINLTKSERRGKTYEELQAMRKERWEANQ
jgi:hypothetical protein